MRTLCGECSDLVANLIISRYGCGNFRLNEDVILLTLASYKLLEEKQ